MSAVLVDEAEEEPLVCVGNRRIAEPLGEVSPPLKPLRGPLPLSVPFDPLPLPLPPSPLPLPLCPPLPLPEDPNRLNLLRHESKLCVWAVFMSMQCLVHGLAT